MSIIVQNLENNQWEHYLQVTDLKQALNSIQIENGIVRILKVDPRGHYKTMGFYEIKNQIIKQIYS